VEKDFIYYLRDFEIMFELKYFEDELNLDLIFEIFDVFYLIN
jgi:hypothetical protein